MGIKGFYGYCARNFPDCHKTIDIVEEIEKRKKEVKDYPVLIINLWTLSYHYNVKVHDLLCGYQLNKIKNEIERFFGKLKSAGASLVFVFKKSSSDDHEFLKRRLQDYHDATQILKKIDKVKSFDKLSTKTFKTLKNHKIPYNVLILVAMIQSAEKYGKVYGADSIYCKPSVTQAELATSLKATWMLGLDTYYFFVPGDWKIWSDDKLNMEKLTVEEYDKEVILKHFEMNYEQMQMMATLSGDIQSIQRIRQKMSDFFGTKNKFDVLKNFVMKLKFPVTDETIKDVVTKILGPNYNPLVIDDFKKSLASFQKNSNAETKIDADILGVIRNRFMCFAEELLLNETAIFITPVFLDFNSKDMEDFNSIVLGWIQKTAGILLKNTDDKTSRKITLLEGANSKFVEVPIEIIFPEFEVNDLKTLINGEASTLDKMKMLYWVVDLDVPEIDLASFPIDYVVDCMILLHLINRKSLTVLEARCILKTLVLSRNDEELKESTDYPEKVNSRALRCSFLYSKCYFILHSCLSCFGMKNYCPEISLDGVLFQKMYAMNVLGESEDEVENEKNDENKPEKGNKNEVTTDEENFTNLEIIELFHDIIF